jgi:adenosylcobinamide-GDP ribazoletransferase
VGLGLAVITSYALLPMRVASAAAVFGFGSSLVLAILARRQIGGYTGDVLGAAEVVAECVVLSVLASALNVHPNAIG